MRNTRFLLALAVCGVLAFAVAACGDDEESSSGSSQTQSQGDGGEDLSKLSGSIAIDGSSTVQPFAEAAAELFQEEASGVKVTVGGAGTGDGFERFCAGETQISDASRPIEDDEKAACSKGNVTPTEVQVANDGIAVVTNPATKIDCLTTDQLKELLSPKSKVAKYSEVEPSFPAQNVTFFTPGEESGTFDFFTDAVLETDAQQRTKDVQTSANDNQSITGIEGTEGALGYLGFSYAEEAGDKVSISQVDGGDGCVAPSKETIQDGSYKPLSRPLFMYPSAEALKKPEVKAFMAFVLANHQKIAEASKIVPMTEEQGTEAKTALGS